MSSAEYEAEYLEGIRSFNARDFFEAHEAWEAVWKRTTGERRLFYKGLIHAAVALHHFGNGNLHGARKVFASCLEYLGPYAPSTMGLSVDRFLDPLRACFRSIARDDANLDESEIPTIQLDLVHDATHP